MDLAKIRKKAQQSQAVQAPPADVTVRVQPLDSTPLELSEQPAANSMMDSLFTVSESIAAVPATEFIIRETDNPLQIILNGRQAAGCSEDELQGGDEEQFAVINDSYLEFLCFKVSDEIYGINIMDIKEIIKPRQVTEVPRAPGFVSGVISLRGTIIPIIDMLLRLGLVREELTGKERVVVIKNGDSFCGLMVDEVIQVVRIAKESVEPAPAILEGIDRDFVSGIGRADGRMVIILNLESIADIHLF